MYYEDYEENRETWQKDLNSWKKRRKSASCLKHTFGFDNDRETSSVQIDIQENTNTRSLKNRKWNKYPGNDDDYDDDQFYDTKDTIENSKEQAQLSPPSAWRQKAHQDDAGAPRSSAPLKTRARPSAADYDDHDDDDDDGYQEKIIKINQMPNNPRGFGFELEGEVEEHTHLSVSRVMRGSSADICGLRAGDEVLSLNGIDVTNHHKDSIDHMIDEAVDKGVIELKVARIRHPSDDTTSCEEEFNIGTNRLTATRWSGSQSSYRSTPPLPPQPDHTGESFTESPPPLPIAPPPAVNWNTFPEGMSGRPEISENGEFKTLRMKFLPNRNEKYSEDDSVFQIRPYRNNPSPPGYSGSSSSSSQTSVKQHSGQLKESMAVQKFKYLEPDNSEELKQSKDKKKTIRNRHDEMLLRTASDSDEGYNSHKYVAEFSATEQDNENCLKTFKGKETNSKEESFLDTNSLVSSANCSMTNESFKSCIPEEEKTSDRRSKYTGSQDESNQFKRMYNHDKDDRHPSEGTKREEAFVNAAAEWRLRDKMMEVAEKEARDMQNRYHKFNRDDHLSNFHNARVPNSTHFQSQEYLTRSFLGKRSEDRTSPPKYNSPSTLQLSKKFKQPEKFGPRKAEYKPVNFQVNKSLVSSYRPSPLNPLSKSYEASRDKVKILLETNYEIDDKKVVEKEYRPYSPSKNILLHSLERSRSEEDLILKESIKNEEMELKKLKTQQEVEKIKLERLREEKKVEELKMQRMREEEEVLKIKEKRLKEESEIKKLERQNKRNDKDPEDHKIKHDSETKQTISEANSIPHVKTNFYQTFHAKSKPYGDANEENEGNPYAKAMRTICTESGLSYDRVAVKSIQLNKPNFFRANDKSKKVSYDQQTSRNQTLNNGRSPKTKSLGNCKYTNQPSKSPSYFGPTFKRLSNNQNTAGDTQQDRSDSGRDFCMSDQESNIKFLLYGENPPEAKLLNQENMGKGQENLSKDQNSKSSTRHPSNRIHDPKKHQISSGADGVKVNIASVGPTKVENKMLMSTCNKDNHVEANTSDRSGSFPYENKKFKFSLNKLKPSYQYENKFCEKQIPTHSPDYIISPSNVQTSRHLRSASIDNLGKLPSPAKDSAADRLFPGKNILPNKQRHESIAPLSFSNIVCSNTFNYSNNTQSTSPNAVDSLFNHNSLNNYNQLVQSSTNFDKRFSASTTNLSHGYNSSNKSPSGWIASSSDHSFKNTNDLGKLPNNYNMLPRQFSRPKDH